MFTGLIAGTGKIAKKEPRGRDVRLSIEASFELVELHLVSWEGRTFTVDVSQETLSRSTIGQRRLGDEVNLERALRLGDRLGGHLVNGHVDGRSKVISREKRGDSLLLEFEVDRGLARYLVEKGSVAVNGVSLTVNRCHERVFQVNVVPHTAQVTTIGKLKVDDEVNIEVDVIGKYVERFVRNIQQSSSGTPEGVDREFLAKHGYI